MKIGILTFHRSYNYGAFMQCFSLSTRLKKELPNATIEVIDYSSGYAMKGYEDAINNADTKTAKKLILRNESFHKCQEQLPLSCKRIVSDNVDEITQYLNDHYDAVVVGSDAVWNWICRGFPNIYFLKDYKGKKFSYAASAHGQIFHDISEDQKEYLKQSFEGFQYIGARDVTTEELVHFVCPKKTVYHNCDPTMFLNLHDVPCDMEELKRKMEARGVDFSRPLIGLMAGEGLGYELRKHYKKKCQIVALYEPNKYADVYLYDLSPFEWAHVFSLFKVTVTHFFHGTMLSLVNHTPVIPIEYSSAFSSIHKTKIQDLMERIGLSSWRFVIDTQNEGILFKVFRHYKIPIDTKIWKHIFSQIDKFLVDNYSHVITEKINREKLYAETFFDAIRAFAEKKNCR